MKFYEENFFDNLIYLLTLWGREAYI